MADCPVCNSRLYEQRMFPRLFKWKFICKACGWQMPVKEVLEAGGIDAIKINKTNIGLKKLQDNNWEEIDRLPDWAYRKMKKRRKNKVNGEHYIYKMEEDKFYRKLKSG